jgi:predicted DNA-binding transcriptional regulator AlpA
MPLVHAAPLLRYSDHSSNSKEHSMTKLYQKTAPWPDSGFVRLNSILAPAGPLPISRSSWWSGVASGRYPKPVKLGPRITAWRVDDLRALMDNAQ